MIILQQHTNCRVSIHDENLNYDQYQASSDKII